MQQGKSLDDALEMFRALNLCCNEVMDSVRRDPGPFSRKFAEATDTTGQRKGDLGNFFADFFANRVTPTLFEVCFLDVVRSFEFMVFELIGDASGNIKSILNDPRSAKATKRTKFPFRHMLTNLSRKEGKISTIPETCGIWEM